MSKGHVPPILYSDASLGTDSNNDISTARCLSGRPARSWYHQNQSVYQLSRRTYRESSMDLHILPDYVTRAVLNTLPASEHLSFPLPGALGHLSSARDFRKTHRSNHPLEPLGNILPAGSSIGLLGPLSTRSRSIHWLKVTSQQRTEISRRNSIIILRILGADVIEFFAVLLEGSNSFRGGLAIIPQRCHSECLPSSKSRRLSYLLQLKFGSGPDSFVYTTAMELIADLGKSHMIFERDSDVGGIGAVNEIDEFSDKMSRLVEVDGG
jgi:hypothetical protein